MSDGNDERRLGSVSGLEVEVGISKWHQPSYDDDTTDVEEQDADIDSTNSFGQISTRILRLSCSNLARYKNHQQSITRVALTSSEAYSNDFGSDVRECRLSRHSPKCQETTCRAGHTLELGKGSWVLPISESDAVMVGPTAQL